MKNTNFKVILWDFDGVILDSMHIRELGFREIFKDYDNELIDKLLIYHKKNGGLSRYVKIKYFFEELLGQSISEKIIKEYAYSFSSIMIKELTDKKRLIFDSITFIRNNYENFKFHIVSGSDENELIFLCEELKINNYFRSIHGSPTTKKKLVYNVLNKYNYTNDETCLIGDSINDYDAAKHNSIRFFGYNNPDLKKYDFYIKNLMSYDFKISI